MKKLIHFFFGHRWASRGSLLICDCGRTKSVFSEVEPEDKMKYGGYLDDQ